MRSDEHVIDEIYSVIGNPGGWSSLLTTIADHVGVVAGMTAYINIKRRQHFSELSNDRLCSDLNKL